jgi:hypothetical protein
VAPRFAPKISTARPFSRHFDELAPAEIARSA